MQHGVLQQREDLQSEEQNHSAIFERRDSVRPCSFGFTKYYTLQLRSVLLADPVFAAENELHHHDD